VRIVTRRLFRAMVSSTRIEIKRIQLCFEDVMMQLVSGIVTRFTSLSNSFINTDKIIPLLETLQNNIIYNNYIGIIYVCNSLHSF
jgi:hypothetical protein